MHVFWRTEKQPLHSHGDWRRRIDRKNREQGTSAPTLAAAWSGPTEVVGALRSVSALEGLRLTSVVVEAQSEVDQYRGPRNHDAVVHGVLPNSARVVVCVEAKAGEHFGATVQQHIAAAGAAKRRAAKEHKISNAPERIEGLLKRFLNAPTTDASVQGLRYQLLTALAGTLSEAATRKASHAVLFFHEFLTDQRRDAKVLEEHYADLRRFSRAVFAVEIPDHRDFPWCVPVPSLPEALDLRLYLAHAVTDLREEALLHRGVSPALAEISADELIRRCEQQGDQAACVELDKRGVTPPILKPDGDGSLP